MMTAFNYIFYRLAKFYYKRDGIEAPRAKGFLTLLQALIVLDILGIIFQSLISLKELSKYSKLGGFTGVAIAVVLMIFNDYYYKGKYWRFADRWRNKETTSQKIIRSFLVFLAFLVPILVFLFLGTAASRV
jgi:hypothetical protein